MLTGGRRAQNKERAVLRKRAGLDALSSTEGPGIRTSEGGRGGVLWGKKTSEGPLGQEGKASPVAFEVCCVYYPRRRLSFDANHPRRKTLAMDEKLCLKLCSWCAVRG